MYSYTTSALGATSVKTWLDALGEHEDVLIIFPIYIPGCKYGNYARK